MWASYCKLDIFKFIVLVVFNIFTYSLVIVLLYTSCISIRRERLGTEYTFNVGFSMGGPGTVTAAYEWDEPAHLMTLKPGISNSYEELFHKATQKNRGFEDFMLLFKSLEVSGEDDKKVEGKDKEKLDEEMKEPLEINKELIDMLSEPRYERYIGVIYRADTQKASHCTMTSLPQEFDAVIYIDETSAVEPIDPTPTWHSRKK